jgi:hypothetical protein
VMFTKRDYAGRIVISAVSDEVLTL